MIDITEQAIRDFKRREELFGANDFNNELGFLPLLVLKPEEEGEKPVIHYEYRVKPGHRNVLGTLHGGIIASLLDGGIGQGAAIITRSKLNTVSLSVTYLEPCMGDRYRIEIDFTHWGNRILDAFARFYDVDNDDLLCATAMGSFILLNEPLPY